MSAIEGVRVAVVPVAALVRLSEAFNEPDGAYRALLIEDCWAPEGELVEAGQRVVSGREDLTQRIAAQQQDPQFWVVVHEVTRSTDTEWGRVRINRLTEAPMALAVVARLNSDGLITRLEATETAALHEHPPIGVRVRGAVTTNPLPAIGLLGGALYVALRIPVGLFYNDLGVTPDEVGLGPEELVPQSLTLLVVFIVAALLFGVLMLIIQPGVRAAQAVERLQRRGSSALAGRLVATIGTVTFIGAATGYIPLANEWYGIFVGLLAGALAFALAGRVADTLPWARVELDQVRARERRAAARWDRSKLVVIYVAVFAPVLLLGAMPIWALSDADAVRGGNDAQGRLSPWRALPAQLSWHDASGAVRLTNDCRHLRLLGTSDGQLVLFDTRLDRVFRVPVARASAAVVRDCQH